MKVRAIIPLLCAAAVTVSGCDLVAEKAFDEFQKTEAAQLVGLAPDEPCVLTRREGKRLAGAYLRQPVAALGFDPVFIDGRVNRKRLARNIQFDDTALRRLRPQDDDGFAGSRKSVAIPRAGFGRNDQLPSVFDLTYRTKKVNYEGPLVVGPGAAAPEIPSSGTAVFTGRVELDLLRFSEDGELTKRKATGQFRFEAGYGSGRGTLAISDLSGDLGFTELTWTRLFLCGTRFVSSGQGEVRVSSGKRSSYPFQTGREPVPLRSIFEASQFAAVDRPGPPLWFGGVLLVESDAGTISAVFLSDDPAPTTPEGAN